MIIARTVTHPGATSHPWLGLELMQHRRDEDLIRSGLRKAIVGVCQTIYDAD